MAVERLPRLAVFGAGRWGRNHVRTLGELGWLAAVADPDPANLKVCKTAWPQTLCRGDVRSLLREVAAGAISLDGAVVAAPAVLHGELARGCLEAGLPVLVEKPLALSVDEARGLVGLARERGLVLAVGHLLEYHPARRALDELVSSGRLGRLLSLRMMRTNLGRLRTEENVLWSFAPHDISTALALAGEEPSLVRATGVAAVDPAIHDTIYYHLDFPGGLTVQGTASWLEPRKEHRLILTGERAMTIWDDTPGRRGLWLHDWDVDRGTGRPELKGDQGQPVPIPDGAPLEAELRAFVRATRGEGDLPTDGAQGVRVLQILEALTQSLRTGGPVRPGGADE